MLNYTIEQFEDRYAQLPEEIRQAIKQSGANKTVWNIGKKYDLHVDEIGILADTIMAVLYGFERPANFISLLKQELGLSELKAGDIGYEIDAQIFAPVRQSIHDLYEHPPQPKPQALGSSNEHDEDSVPLPGQEAYHQRGGHPINFGSAPAGHIPFGSTMPPAPNTPTDSFPIHRPVTPAPTNPRPVTPPSRIGSSDPYRETIE